ncbi:hypothetical protein BDA99DRAFT_605544 [Phascolomyces articulosus]|uniref:Uncharacterized protein n=1 Tax=Phascolomyces articulosus TaxID=60185 RepID=A0AAD5JYB9_9FUNG|nr:hypothetical protein BDA99DRAFT_605544 [Phascolomyces articulosus]
MNNIRSFVQETISGRREANEQEEVPADHQVGKPEQRPLPPFQFDPSQYPQVFQAGQLFAGNAPARVHQQQVVYYVRVSRSSKQQLLHDLTVYEDQFGADREWAEYLRLALQQNNNITRQQQVSLLYFGMTLSKTPERRLYDDLSNVAHTRFTNFNSAVHRNWTVYIIQQIPVQYVHNVNQLINHPWAGLMEDVWITSSRRLCLNSAHGGFHIDWVAPAELIQQWVNLNVHVGPTTLGTIALPQVTRNRIINHFDDYRRFLNRIPGIGNRPSVELVNTTALTVTPLRVTNQGYTVSLLVGKDITIHNLLSNTSFWQPNEGVAPSFMRRLFGFFHRTWLPPFVDLYPLSTIKSLQLTVPFLTRYLKLAKPLIVITMSNPVYTVFQYDMFSTTWTDNRQRFMVDLFSPETIEDLAELMDARYPQSSSGAGFAINIGRVSVVRYGPDIGDACLCIALRHPGNLSYDPVVQRLKCTEMFYTLCLFFVLQDTVHQLLHTLPANENELMDWLIGVKEQYENRAETTELTRIFDTIKTQVRNADRDNFSARMLASRNRSRGIDQEITRPARAPFSLYFEGAPRSIQRDAQLNHFRAWFRQRGAGINMNQSARDTGRNPMAGLNEQQRRDYLRIRGLGPFRAVERVTNRNTAPFAVNIQELATETTWSVITASNLVRIATCSFCDNTFHRCPERAGATIPPQEGGLQYFRAMYAHDILEQDQLDIDQHTLQQLRINSFDAVTILNQHNLNFDDANVGALGRIYATFDAREELLITQAVDKWIVSTGHGVATLPNDHTSDGWLFDKGAIKISVRRHFFTNEQDRRAPLVQATCGAAGGHCRFASIIHPTRSGRRNVLLLRFNNQHQYNAEMALRTRHLLQEQHPAGQRQQIVQEAVAHVRNCTFGPVMNTFRDLPLAAKRFLWSEYRKGPQGAELRPGVSLEEYWVSPLDWDPDLPVAPR